MEIKPAGEFIVFKRKGFGVEVGKGENRRALSKRVNVCGQANSNLTQQHPTP